MPDTVERLVACGVNLADAWDAVEDFFYDEDPEGLEAYVLAVEAEYRRQKGNVAAV